MKIHCFWLTCGSVAAMWASSAIHTTVFAQAQVDAHPPGRAPQAAKPAAQKPAGLQGARPVPAAGLEEIVVTASKRRERALNVAGAITAFRGVDLLRSGTTSLQDLAGFTPGLQVNNSVGSGAPIIRGLSLGIDTSPTVAIVVDGAAIGSSSSLSFGAQESFQVDPIDINRIEILKGPQGTLYGANTLGGLVSYTLNQASLDRTQGTFQSEFLGTPGGDPSYAFRGALSGPIVPNTLGAALSGYYNEHGGFVNNATRGLTNENHGEEWNLRGSLLLTPNDDLRITLDGFSQRSDAKANDVVLYNFATRQPRQADLQYNQAVLPAEAKNTNAGIVDIDYDLGFASLTSVTSLQYIHSYDVQNATDGGITSTLAGILPAFGAPHFPNPVALQEDRPNITHKTTQEIRLTSPSDQRFTWIVGGYYAYEHDFDLPQYTGQYADGATVPVLDPALRFSVLSRYEEYSGFVDGTFKITPTLDLTGGYRLGQINQTFSQLYSGSDSATLNELFGIAAIPPVPAIASGKSVETVRTYLATLRYHFSPDGIVFARFSTGFRPGGPNINAPGLPSTFSPDHTMNYETGVKSLFWGNKGSVDVTGYYEQWNNIIVVQAVGGLAGYNNGGNARIYGVEAAVSLRPIPHLTLHATFAYSKANITSAFPSAVTTLAVGDPLPYDPLASGSFTAEYRTKLTETFDGYVSGAVRAAGSRYSSFRSSPVTPYYLLPSYALFDLHAGVDVGRWNVDLLVNNIFDARAQLAANTFFNIAEVTIARPRTFGVVGTYKF